MKEGFIISRRYNSYRVDWFGQELPTCTTPVLAYTRTGGITIYMGECPPIAIELYNQFKVKLEEL